MGSATIASCQIPGANALRQLLIRTQATNVALIRVERLGEVAEHAEGVQNSEDDLHPDGTVAVLKASDGVSGHACPIPELSLGEPAKLAPRFSVRAKIPQGTAHR